MTTKKLTQVCRTIGDLQEFIDDALEEGFTRDTRLNRPSQSEVTIWVEGRTGGEPEGIVAPEGAYTYRSNSTPSVLYNRRTFTLEATRVKASCSSCHNSVYLTEGRKVVAHTTSIDPGIVCPGSGELPAGETE